MNFQEPCLDLVRAAVKAALTIEAQTPNQKHAYMAKPNTDRFERLFDEATKQTVWQKGQPVQGYDSVQYRKDTCGAWMEYKEHGNVNSARGWEIDHVKPKAANGGDELANLQPLNWENNRFKSDNYPNWTCKVKHS